MTAATSNGSPVPLSILHVLAPGPAGGLESVVAALATGQHARGHRVSVVSVTGPGGEDLPLHRQLRSSGIELRHIELPARAYGRERAQYREIFSSQRPDLVHTHGYRSDVLAGAVAGALRLPRVTTVHGFTGGDWKNRVYELLQVRAFKRYEAVVPVSRPLEARLAGRGVPKSSMTVIPNGFDTAGEQLSRSGARAALGLDPGATVIGWVGRMSREKGLDVMLEALARLDRPGVLLSVIGEGKERTAMEARAAELGVAGQVRWHGLVPNAGRLYGGFDLFVLSSRTEGTPISLFEAMAAGVPSIATAVGGVPDVLEAGAGWLVPPENPAALATAMATALDDRSSATGRAARARQRLETIYGLAPWLDRYDLLYRSILPTRTR